MKGAYKTRIKVCDERTSHRHQKMAGNIKLLFLHSCLRFPSPKFRHIQDGPSACRWRLKYSYTRLGLLCRNVPVSTNEKKNDNLPSCSSSSSSSSSSWSNHHKLKLTARLLKLRRRPHRLARIGFASGSARQEPIAFGRCFKPRPRCQYIIRRVRGEAV